MSTQEQRNEKAFDEWAKEWWFDGGVDDSTRTACRYAWKAAEAAAIDRCAKVAEAHSAIIATTTAQLIAKNIRALLPKEES